MNLGMIQPSVRLQHPLSEAVLAPFLVALPDEDQASGAHDDLKESAHARNSIPGRHCTRNCMAVIL